MEADVHGSIVGSLLARWQRARPPATVEPRGKWPVELRRLRWLGIFVLVAELVVFCRFALLQVHSFSIAIDYSLYNQPTFLVSQGHLNPYSSVWGFPFWKNDGEFVFWVLAAIVRIFTQLATLKTLQVLAIFGAQLIAFNWICDLVASRDLKLGWSQALIALGALLLVANPWFLWTIADDVHSEAFAALPLMAAARALWSGQTRRGMVWALLTMVCGGGAASYMVALGLGLALSGRYWWRQGIAIAAAGLVWVMVLTGVNATLGPAIGAQYGKSLGGALKHHFSGMGLVEAIVAHPGRAWHGLWSNKLNIWATIAPAGLIGALWPPFLIPAVIVLAEGALAQGHGSAIPSFQNIVLAPLISVGTIAWLIGLPGYLDRRGGAGHRHRRLIVTAVVAIFVVNAIGWAATWFPQARQTWVTVPSKPASALARLRATIPRGDEVVTEHGVAGGFSDRKYLYVLENARAGIPIHTRTVWLVFTPNVGIEFSQPGPAYADIQQVAELPGAKLVMAKAGVWAFRWTVPAGTKTLQLNPDRTGTPQMTWQANLNEILALRERAGHDASGASFKIPAWLVTGAAGRPERAGAATSWHASATGGAGYLVAQAYFLKTPGRYLARVSLAVAGLPAGRGVRVEVWNANAGRLLATRTLSGTRGRRTVTLPISFRAMQPGSTFSGWGPFSISPIPAGAGNDLEIRVWTPGGSTHIAAYWLSLS